MGAWVTYNYVTEIIKSEVRISRIYRRHFCTVVYLPSTTSCTTDKLVTRHGKLLHRLSGQRIGFLFIAEFGLERHEGDSRPLPPASRIEQNWRYKLGYNAAASTIVRSKNDYQWYKEIGSPIRGSRELARDLGLLESAPCIVIICHYFSNQIYKYKLRYGTPDEILDFFDTFCSSFYDSNFILFRALDTVEDGIDQAIYTRQEVESVLDALKRDLGDIRTFRSAFDPMPLARSFLSARRHYSSIVQVHDRLLAADGTAACETLDEAESALRICSDLAVLLQRLEAGSPKGMPFNETVQRLSEMDRRLLCKLQTITKTRVDFGAILANLEKVPGGHQRRTAKLKAYLQKRGWTNAPSVSIGFSAEEIGPLFALSAILRKVSVSHREDCRNDLDAVTSLLADCRRTIFEAFGFYKGIACESIDIFLDSLGRIIGDLDDRLAAGSGGASRGDYLTCSAGQQARDLAELKEALISISSKVALPSKWLEQFVVVPNVYSADRLEDIISMFRSGDLSALLKRHESPVVCNVATGGNGPSAPEQGSASVEDMEPRASLGMDTDESAVELALPVRVFISYSHTDKRWVERLQKHLKPMERSALLDRWDDTRIKPGEIWRDEIRRALETAEVAVLLVSADFLASDFIHKVELPLLLAAAKMQGLRVLPVILSASLFDKTPSLSQFQAVNRPDRPLNSLRKAEQEAIFVKVARVIADAVHSRPPLPRDS